MSSCFSFSVCFEVGLFPQTYVFNCDTFYQIPVSEMHSCIPARDNLLYRFIGIIIWSSRVHNVFFRIKFLAVGIIILKSLPTVTIL